ncbi:MAG: 3-phosphoshikimate 1-carboxyvinyltransferase [Candidatus Sumerlaeaceae bacterium]
MSSVLDTATGSKQMTSDPRQTDPLIALPQCYADAVISPAIGPLQGTITAQPSKNYTSRYLLAAALADGESIVRNCATSDDARAMQRGLRALGAGVEVLGSSVETTGEDVHVIGVAGKPHVAVSGESIDVGNAGAVLRLLLGVSALCPDVTFVTSHPQSLGKRPNADLLDALEQLGCRSKSVDGLLPITMHGGELHGGKIEVSGARSSQFLSALLFLAPLVGHSVRIDVRGGLVSKAPVRQTLEVLRNAGVHIEYSPDLLSFDVEPQCYRAGEYIVNGDWPGSAAILSAAVVTGGSVELQRLVDDEQGERAAANVLQEMGATLQFVPNGGGVRTSARAGDMHAVEFDGDLATDAVLALMGAACLANGRSRFYNVSNLRIKECDRISEPLRELRKLGVNCWEGNEVGDSDPDAIIIEGNPLGYEGGVTLDGRGDHRVIMLLSVVALRCRKPVRITGANDVAKSYPAFFSHLAALGADVKFETGRS